MMRKIEITRAGYLYINGKKATERKIDPFYCAPELLSVREREIARDWTTKNYVMAEAR